MKTKKPLTLTNAQIFTLRRMNSGMSYSLRGDGKKAQENRPTIAVERGLWHHAVDPVNAPSIPVLFRLGLVRFKSTGAEPLPTLWYRVELTEKGVEAAQTLQIEQKD